MLFGGLKEELKQIREEQTRTTHQIALNTQQLSEHMRRTELLEKRVESIWTKALLALSIIGAAVTLVKSLIG